MEKSITNADISFPSLPVFGQKQQVLPNAHNYHTRWDARQS
jgi:hypothetical protein